MTSRYLHRLAACFVCLAHFALAAPEIEDLHRLYDMSPVSADNPVVARVVECGIEIPLREFERFALAEAPAEPSARALTLPEKRALLERLIDEHLLLWNAFKQKWDQAPGVTSMVDGTRNMMLMETILEKEVVEKAHSPAEQRQLAQALRDQCFEKASVVVSNESYEALKLEAKKLQAASTAVAPPVDSALPAATRDRPLAKCDEAVLTIGNFWDTYLHLPADRRPDLEKPEAVTALLKDMLSDAALIAEARARAYDRTVPFRERLQLNRNMLTRFYAQDRITDKAVARLKGPDGERNLRAWYEHQLGRRYPAKNGDTKAQLATFEAQRESIENDYFAELQEQVRDAEAQALRAGRRVAIDEPLLRKTEVRLQSSVPEHRVPSLLRAVSP